MAKAKNTVCFEIDLGCGIRLEQAELANHAGLFAVTYGKQVDSNLTHSEACEELGRAIMHALACESMLNNGEHRSGHPVHKESFLSEFIEVGPDAYRQVPTPDPEKN